MIIQTNKKGMSFKNKSLALFQAATIVLSIIAFTYLVAMTIPSVSAFPPGQCAIIDKGTSTESYWQMGSNNMLSCVTGHCNPPTTDTFTENNFCVVWLGCGTSQGGSHCSSICSQQSDGSWSVKSSALGSCPAASPSSNSRNLLDTANTVVDTANSITSIPTNAGGIKDILKGITSGVTSDVKNLKGFTFNAPNPSFLDNFANPNPYTGVKGWIFNPTIAGKLSIANIVATAATAAGLYAVTQWAFGKAGANAEFSHAAGLGVGAGYFASQIVSKLGIKILGFGSTGVGVIVGIAVLLISWKSVRYQSYQFNCYPWTPPTGGHDCSKCNNGQLPCTEYTCRSLGQGCELVNQGTGEELCVWNNSRDVTPPIMQPWLDILTPGYKYTPDNTLSPPNNGVKIVPLNDNNGCINSSSSLTFGVTTNEPAICKWDTDSSLNFSSMNNFFDGSPVAIYNHSQMLTQLPDANALAAENATIENGNKYSIYASCQNTNGYADVGDFVFKFCVNPSPDTEAPLIETTSILNGSPIEFNTSSVNLSVFVKDSYPVNCRWSSNDQDYSTMENNMTCPESIVQVNDQGLYQCKTTLNGLISSQNNTFYFRCQDTSPQQNKNSQSYAYTLIGTQPLIITSVGPNSTVINSTNVVKVTLTATTAAGYNQGDSQCSFSTTGNTGSYDTFFSDAGNNFNNYQHSQDVYLVPGNYNYYIQCIDQGGNTATNMTSFTVQSDTSPPIVVRAYNDNNNLKIITDENSTCVYNTDSNIGCTYQFSDGSPMQNSQGNVNQIAWDVTKTFYIKCMDSFGNQPDSDACSIIASPYSISNSNQ